MATRKFTFKLGGGREKEARSTGVETEKKRAFGLHFNHLNLDRTRSNLQRHGEEAPTVGQHNQPMADGVAAVRHAVSAPDFRASPTPTAQGGSASVPSLAETESFQYSMANPVTPVSSLSQPTQPDISSSSHPTQPDINVTMASAANVMGLVATSDPSQIPDTIMTSFGLEVPAKVSISANNALLPIPDGSATIMDATTFGSATPVHLQETTANIDSVVAKASLFGPSVKRQPSSPTLKDSILKGAPSTIEDQSSTSVANKAALFGASVSPLRPKSSLETRVDDVVSANSVRERASMPIMSGKPASNSSVNSSPFAPKTSNGLLSAEGSPLTRKLSYGNMKKTSMDILKVEVVQISADVEKALLDYKRGSFAYFLDNEDAWTVGEVVSDACKNDDGEFSVEFKIMKTGGSIVIKKSVGQLYVSDLPPLKNPVHLDNVVDLSSLSHLHEPAIFSGIKNRFSTKEIYTYSGMALIAVNPFERVPIYGLDSMKQYADKSREEAAPHVYGIAEECYRAMLRGSNQSVIVSGESGAGKTQSTRYIMQYLASVDSLSGLEHTGSVLRSNETNEAVLASNPILESFGNAKTTRNDNSSRFGKFVQLYFSDSSNSCITGAKIKTYLLERSRLIFQASSERNYHIFYQLCSALEAKQKEKLGLTRWEDFEYLNQGNAGVVRTINDTTDFADLQEAMVKIGITQEIQSNIFKICSALLHLGNAKILPGETIDGNLDTETSVLSPKDPSLLKFCELVGTDPVLLVKWITNIQKDINREKIVKPLKLDSALIARDSVAKVIYMKLFDWLVDVINKNLAREYSPSQNFIGVLDIYGFEHFDINSFEQFCINYANEKLQQEFTRHVFRLEQEEYVSEGIAWNKIQFNDNQPCIDLIENRVGILSMLDDNSKANGTDQQFVGAMNNELAANGCFRKARFGADTFCVQHYALEVQYTAAGFIEKNRDTVSHELKEVLAASSDDFFKTVMEGLLAGAEAVPEGSSTPASKRRSTLAKTNTLGSMFKRDLESLMVTLRQTEGHYIRCIKPNAEKVAFKFDGPMVLGQLKACGVLETIRISNAGYPNKMTYEEFAEKFGLLLNEAEKRRAASPRDLCTMIIEFVLKDSLLYQFGENKVFFKSGQIAFFEDRRKDRLDALKMLVFRSGRAFLTRCKFLKTKRAAQTLQMVVRTYLAQKHLRLLVERKAATLQADARARAAVLIQTYWRGHRNRQAFLEKSRIICVLQKVIRSRAAVKRLRTLKTEAKDVGNMKLELATLRTQVAAISTEKKASEAVWFAKCASLESELQVLVAKVRDMEGSRAARDPNDERLTQSHSQNKEELKTMLERLEMKEEKLTELQAQLECVQTQSKRQVSWAADALLRLIPRSQSSTSTHTSENLQAVKNVQAMLDAFISSDRNYQEAKERLIFHQTRDRAAIEDAKSMEILEVRLNQMSSENEQSKGHIADLTTELEALKSARNKSVSDGGRIGAVVIEEPISQVVISKLHAEPELPNMKANDDLAQIEILQSKLKELEEDNARLKVIIRRHVEVKVEQIDRVSALPLNAPPLLQVISTSKSTVLVSAPARTSSVIIDKATSQRPTLFSPRISSLESAEVIARPRTSSLANVPADPKEVLTRVIAKESFVHEVCEALIYKLSVPIPAETPRLLENDVLFVGNMFGILIHQLIELGNSSQLIALVNAILNALNERVEQDLQRDTVEESIFWLANVRQLISIAQGIKVLPIVQGASWKLNLLEHLINELEDLSWKTLFAGISDNLCEESITLALDVFFSDDEGGVADLESLVLSIHNACKSYHLQESLNVRILTEILANIGVNIFNELLAREGWLTSKRARKIRLDVNSMEQAFIALDLPLDYDYFGMLLEAMRAISMVKEDGTLEVESVLEEMTLLNVQQVYRIVCSCVSQCLVPLSARESLRTEALASKLPLKASVEDLQIEFDRPVVVPIKIESSFALVPPKLKLFGDLSLLFRQIMILHQ